MLFRSDVMLKEMDSTEDRTIMFLFRRLYERKNIHCTRWFHFCRKFAISVLARSTAFRLFHNKANVPDFVLQPECRKRLKELWELLDDYRPCEAMYMGKGYGEGKKAVVYCFQHKAAHETEHQTSLEVYGATWLRRLFKR